MSTAIDFYFDFSSPYGYLASKRIDALADRYGREVRWRPILLGPAFKASGNAPLIGQPLKGDYAKLDIPRTARFMGITYRHPDPFPIGTQNAARAFYWMHDRDPAMAKRFAAAAYDTYFGNGIDIASGEKVAEIAASVGASAQEVQAAIADHAVKERLKTEVDASLAKGVFGSPYFIVDGEPFWGCDRLDQVETWLRTGGF